MMSALFNHLWQSTVFAVAVALLTLVFRRNQARLRYGLWFVASVKFLMPFAALAAAGSLVEWRQPPAPIVSVMTATAIRGFNTPACRTGSTGNATRFPGRAPDGPVPSAWAMAVMQLNLLKDRFKLVTHTATREMAVYNLVFAREDKRLGPALKETSAECVAKLAKAAQQLGTVPPAVVAECVKVNLNPGIVRFNAVQIALMVNFLTQSVGRPVIDKTGLTGWYDVTLKWTPEPGGGQPAPFGLPPSALPGVNPLPPPTDPEAPNLFTAVQEQLGLKLESARGPVEFVVIDRFEKPTFD
jgi:uncharacterized protein (TIGR03435 family)